MEKKGKTKEQKSQAEKKEKKERRKEKKMVERRKNKSRPELRLIEDPLNTPRKKRGERERERPRQTKIWRDLTKKS